MHCFVLVSEAVDFSPFVASFVFSQQQSAEQCVTVSLLPDNDPNEGTEQFTVMLNTSSSMENVILNPTSAIVSIADSVTSILSDLLSITGSDDQSEENLQFVSGVVEDIADSASNGELVVDMEVHVCLICTCVTLRYVMISNCSTGCYDAHKHSGVSICMASRCLVWIII